MNALITLNIGGKYMHRKCRDSLQAAAKRWNCDYIEITTPVTPNVHHYWQKLFVSETHPQYDRILQLDADMLIRCDAPSPFDLFPASHLGVVTARQSLGLAKPWIDARVECINFWAQRYKLKRCPDQRHLNGGFFLYSPKLHTHIFQQAIELGRKYKFQKTHLPEQATLSLVLWNNPQLPTQWLPHTWNANAPVMRERMELAAPPVMKRYIYHFTGRDKNSRINKTWWNYPDGVPRTSPVIIQGRTESLINHLGYSPEWGVEVGVMRGWNTVGLLEKCPNLHMFLVDRWMEYHPNTTYARSKDDNARWKMDDWRLLFEEAMINLAPHWGRFQILQGDSVHMSHAIADDSMDFVFIDADHSYEGCKADIEAWLPKVKSGGMIGGHDYNHPKPTWGVKRAVQEKFGNPSIGKDLTWFVRVE